MAYNAISESLPPVIVGRVKDEYFRAGDTTQRFPIGQIYRLGRKAYVYAKAGGTLNPDLGASPYNFQHIGNTTIAKTTIVGQKDITIDVSNAMGTAGTGAMAKDELFNGEMVLMDHDGKIYTRGILGNTAIVADGGSNEMTVKIDHGIEVALTENTDHAECMASPYIDVRTDGASNKSVVGIPVCIAKNGEFCFLQTWGPCWVAPQTAVGTGNNDRQVVFRHDGSVDRHDTGATTKYAQHAGWNMANGIGGGQGAALIFLQISY